MNRNETLSFSVGPDTPSLNIAVFGMSISFVPRANVMADWVEKHNFGKDIEIGEADVDVCALLHNSDFITSTCPYLYILNCLSLDAHTHTHSHSRLMSLPLGSLSLDSLETS